MGQIARYISLDATSQILSGEGLHGSTMSYFIDPVPGLSLNYQTPTGSVTVDQATGKWSIALSSLNLAAGGHTIRFALVSHTLPTGFTGGSGVPSAGVGTLDFSDQNQSDFIL